MEIEIDNDMKPPNDFLSSAYFKVVSDIISKVTTSLQHSFSTCYGDIMIGKNLASDFLEYKSFEQRMEIEKTPCVFLSHRSLDKDRVIKIGNYIMKAGLNIYLDLNDNLLQQASSINNAKVMTQCIQNGILKSAHIICIISDSTFNETSWWVPYEIGFADHKKVECSIMQLSNVANIPEFMKVKNVISTIIEFNNLLKKISNSNLQILNETSQYGAYQQRAILNFSSNHVLSGILK